MHPTTLFTVAALLLLLQTPATADETIRCGSRIVRIGDTAAEVAGKCGAADSTRTWSETRTETIWDKGYAIERQVLIVYDEWLYNLGRNRLVRELVFTDGRLSQIATSGYGK